MLHIGPTVCAHKKLYEMGVVHFSRVTWVSRDFFRPVIYWGTLSGYYTQVNSVSMYMSGSFT